MPQLPRAWSILEKVRRSFTKWERDRHSLCHFPRFSGSDNPNMGQGSWRCPGEEHGAREECGEQHQGGGHTCHWTGEARNSSNSQPQNWMPQKNAWVWGVTRPWDRMTRLRDPEDMKEDGPSHLCPLHHVRTHRKYHRSREQPSPYAAPVRALILEFPVLELCAINVCST